jgi:O-antigen/teichoic acid export membrane protein
MGENELLKTGVKSIIWNSVDFFFSKIFLLVVQVVLARILLPKEFGLIGIIVVFTSIAQTLMDSGLTLSLVREKHVTDEEYSTIFWFNVGLGLCLYALIFVFAPTIENFFAMNHLSVSIRVASLAIVIQSFSQVQHAILKRRIDFRSLAIASILSNLFSGIVAILFAIKGFGAWALIFQSVSMTLFSCLILTIQTRWVPSLVFTKKILMKHLAFSWKVLMSTLIGLLNNNIFSLVLGKIFPATSLGYYTNANKFNTTVTSGFASVIQRVSYPILSKINNNGQEMEGTYTKIIRMIAYLIFPIMLGIASCSDEIIIFIFGERWIESAPILKIIILGSLLVPIININSNVLLVKGDSTGSMRISIIQTVTALVFIMIGMLYKVDMKIIVFAMIPSMVIGYGYSNWRLHKILDVSPLSQIKALLAPFIYSIIMYGGVSVIEIDSSNVACLLLAKVSSGVILYILISFVMQNQEFYYIYKVFVSRIKSAYKHSLI